MGQRSHHASITLYTEKSCPFGHQIRFLLHEKQIDCRLVFITAGQWPEQVLDANPEGFGPTLFDRDLVLYDTRIILEYFDERFPHPSLMPADPGARAQVRLMLQRIYQEWYSLWPILENNKDKKHAQAKKRLREDLTVLAPLFEQSRFFMSDDLGLLDCSIAPLLWRLKSLDIQLPNSARAIEKYSQNLFARSAFQSSLTETERSLR